ncbi:hypothetical protein FCM35_KLT11775 [Carex littledalei]|uniref:Uncharacterized protein n=1 Tax=Carex littledalei TaxID=544730 RepID=A0A833QRQ5_9POAL|nr:hypothetical protein FCM35_KLT11775 [Carex littledalei]
MDISGELRSIFPLASLFYPPNLPSSSSLPPFTHLSPSLILLSSPSLLPHLPSSTPTSLHFYTLHSFLRSEVPCSSPSPPSLRPSRPSPPSNLLVSLPSYLPRTLHLFFPTGENAHAIAFLSITSVVSSSPNPFQLTLDHTGDVFKQTEGFKHPLNRISSLSVSPCSGIEAGSAPGLSLSGNRVSEGFLLATTLYAVNWFRIETGPFQLDCEEKQRPFLVPLANHGFENPVVHACFSPHIKEESAVLLQSGELYLFNICSKRSGRIRVSLNNGQKTGRFISCEYGAEPWIIIVACAKYIILVDLRNPGEGQTRILFQPKKLGSYNMNLLERRKENFLVFCKSSYSNYHFSVITKYQLMLLDVRRPLHPILTWEHGLDDPNYITMLNLEELKPSNGHEPLPGSGFSILAGSLSTSEFKLFHYGSINKQEGSSDSSFCAWGVPSGIYLSGQCSGIGNQLVDKLFSEKSTFVNDISWLRKRETVVGFLVIPRKHSLIEPDSSGFTVIRVMSFGRLEVQNYGPSEIMPGHKTYTKEEGMSGSCDIVTACPDCMREEVPSRRYLLDLRYVNAYVHGDLSEILPMDNRQSCEASLSEDLLSLIRDSMNYTPSLSPFIDNATVPSSIVEIAYKSTLNGLKSDLIPLAFAKFSDIFPNKKRTNFQLLDVARSSTSGEQQPLIVTKPYRRGQRWSKKTKAPRDKLVGPVLPVPVLLTLEERERNGTCFSFEGDGTIVDKKCIEVHDSIFPANLNADTEATSENKPCFVYEPQCDIIRSKKLKRGDKSGCRDGNYETFVCGVNTRSSCDKVKPDPDVAGPELFDFGPVRMDFDLSKMAVGKIEQEELEKLKGKISNWLNEFKPYQDFCSSSKIPKLNQ